MLHVTQLSRNYGNFVAVDKVSFDIARGEIVGLLGHNGAGKTTIMKMLSGYLEPNTGTIAIDGLDLAKHTKQIQARLGYLPESLPVYQDMVVADYLDFAAELKGLRTDDKHAEIRRVVAATRIEACMLAPVHTLSRGFKQRVGVAQAILGRPKLLILDEPTNGLDPTQTEHMRELIRDLAAEATVILSTHIMQEVEAVCDRVLLLRSGRLAVDSALQDLRQGAGIVLTTSLNPAQVAAAPGLGKLEPRASTGSSSVAGEPAVFSYWLALSGENGQLAECGRLAKEVQEAGGELYELYQERRDLESLFREANRSDDDGQREDDKDAA